MNISMTRSDFEALLWSHLHETLPNHVTNELINNIGIGRLLHTGPLNIDTNELQTALDTVRSDLARHVFDRTIR